MSTEGTKFQSKLHIMREKVQKRDKRGYNSNKNRNFAARRLCIRWKE